MQKGINGNRRHLEKAGVGFCIFCVFFFCCCCYKNIVINVVLNNVSNDKNKKNIYININKPSIFIKIKK